MRVAVIGATGGVGAAILEQAIASGHAVTALVRDSEKLKAHPAVAPIVGDIRDADAVARAVEGADAVLWAVGATSNKADQVAIFQAGARNLVAAMSRHGVGRLIALSGAGITLEGERKPISGRVMSVIVRVAARHVYEAKRREYEVFTTSDLDWTLVRPPRVVEGPRTGRVVVGDRLASSQVTQGDVADAMLQQLSNPTHLRGAPFVSTLP
jgi:putative NADH-flavin reductase